MRQKSEFSLKCRHPEVDFSKNNKFRGKLKCWAALFYTYNLGFEAFYLTPFHVREKLCTLFFSLSCFGKSDPPAGCDLGADQHWNYKENHWKNRNFEVRFFLCIVFSIIITKKPGHVLQHPAFWNFHFAMQFSMFFFVIFRSIFPKSWLNPGLDPEISQISPTLRSCISELNEDFLKIRKDFESSRLDLSENAI